MDKQRHLLLAQSEAKFEWRFSGIEIQFLAVAIRPIPASAEF
jgi:hypothetical protein